MCTFFTENVLDLVGLFSYEVEHEWTGYNSQATHNCIAKPQMEDTIVFNHNV
jgi:hypothetical protein